MAGHRRLSGVLSNRTGIAHGVERLLGPASRKRPLLRSWPNARLVRHAALRSFSRSAA